MGRLRSAVAVGLALLFPGLGHLYLRQWVRAILWSALWILAALLLLPDPATGGTSAERMLSTVESMSLQAQFVLLSLILFNVIDAFVISVQQARYDPDAVHCPQCGGEVDEDIDFCHWCTTRLGNPSEEESTTFR